MVCGLSVARCLIHVTLLGTLAQLTSGDNLFYANLPDGMHNVLIGRRGGLYLAGFDSRRRVCVVLFAPPFGQPLRRWRLRR